MTSRTRYSLAGLSLSRIHLCALLLTGSIWLLPFSRSFHLVLLALFLGAVYRVFADRSCFGWKPATRVWLLSNACFALPILISAFTSGDSAKPLELFFLQAIIFFSGFVVIDLVRDEKMLEVFHWISLFVLLFWTVDLLIQVSFGADVFGYLNRARPGIYFSSHFKFGFYYAALSPLLLFNPLFLRWKTTLKLAVYFAMLATVLFCNTRSAWLVFAFVSLPWFVLLLKNGGLTRLRLTASVLAIPIIVLALAFANEDFRQRLVTLLPMFDNLKGVQDVIPIRTDLWFNLGAMVREHLYFGSGAGNFERAYVMYSDVSLGPAKIYPHAHQVILDLLVGTGLVGVASWCVLHWVIAKQWMRAHRRELALPFILVPLLMWLPLNSHRNVFSSELMQFTWIWLAMAIGLLAKERPGVEVQ